MRIGDLLLSGRRQAQASADPQRPTEARPYPPAPCNRSRPDPCGAQTGLADITFRPPTQLSSAAPGVEVSGLVSGFGRRCASSRAAISASTGAAAMGMAGVEVQSHALLQLPEPGVRVLGRQLEQAEAIACLGLSSNVFHRLSGGHSLDEQDSRVIKLACTYEGTASASAARGRFRRTPPARGSSASAVPVARWRPARAAGGGGRN
jgi:hypothetical protein